MFMMFPEHGTPRAMIIGGYADPHNEHGGHESMSFCAIDLRIFAAVVSARGCDRCAKTQAIFAKTQCFVDLGRRQYG